MIEQIGNTIVLASRDRPYGLYDYSMYKGEAPPHQVWDERVRERIFASWNREEAEAEYNRLNKIYVAKAAITVLLEPTEELKEFDIDNDLFAWDCNCNYCGGHKFAVQSYLKQALLDK